MQIEFKLPDVFVPDEKRFCLYCAIKMFKDHLISEDEAIKMANIEKELFNTALKRYEKKFAALAGDELVDSVYMEDKDFTKNSL